MSDFFADTGAWFEQGFIDIGNVILGNSKAPDNDPVTGLSEVDVRHDPVSEHSATDVWYGPVDDTYYDSIINPVLEPELFINAAIVAKNVFGHDPRLEDVMMILEHYEASGRLGALAGSGNYEMGMDSGMGLHFLTQVAEGQQEMPVI